MSGKADRPAGFDGLFRLWGKRLGDFRQVSMTVIGLSLVISALLKAWELVTRGTEPLVPAAFMVPLELLLGIWLTLGTQATWTCLAGAACFGVFGVVSFGKALSGQSTCGCFGAIDVNPWWTFAYDLGAAIMLVFWARGESTRTTAWHPTLLRFGVLTLTASALCALLGSLVLVLTHGSVHAGVSRLQGHSIEVRPAIKHLGSIRANDTASVTFELVNLESVAVTVVGAKTSCRCATVSTLPMTLGPGERADLTLNIKPVQSDVGKRLSPIAVLYLDRPSRRPILRVEAEVLPTSDSASHPAHRN